jgi:kynurenine formamidase
MAKKTADSTVRRAVSRQAAKSKRPSLRRRGARTPAQTSAASTSTAKVLERLVAGLLSDEIRVIDLTQTLSPSFPTIALSPEFGQAAPFRIEEVSRYDERGPAWYWNNFSCGEHTGTHFDAPIHWVSGRDLPNNATDTLSLQHVIGAACVIDCVAEATRDPDYLLTVEKLLEWESRHGRIPAGSWLLMRTDWSKRADPAAYQNYDATGQHTPGPSVEAVEFLVRKREVMGFGSEQIGTDAGQAYHLRPPYPCHSMMHGSGRYGLQCLTNLDLLPPTGAIVICAPLKIEQGSGSPIRALALVASERNVVAHRPTGLRR